MGLPINTVQDWFRTNQGWDEKYAVELEKPGLNKTAPKFGDDGFAELIRQLVDDLKTRDEMLLSYANLLADNTPDGNATGGNAPGGNATGGNATGDTNGTATKDADTKKRDPKEPAKKKDTTTPPERPKVPVGKPIDISAGTLTIDDVTWEIPTMKSVAGGEKLGADDLDDWAWLAVMKNTNALYGTRLDTLLEGRSSRSRRTPLMFRLPGHNDWWQAENRSDHKGTLDYSSSTHQARSSAFFSAEIGGSYAFCSASASASYATASVAQMAVKRTYLTGYWRVPRAVISLEQCTTVNPAFVEAARKAIGITDHGRRFAELTTLFEDFGHVYYRTVVLGGTAYFQTSRIASASAREDEVRATLAAAVQYKSADGSGASGKAEYQTAEGSKETAQQLAESMAWTMIGGTSSKNGDVPAWLPTVDNAKEWALIDREGAATSTITLLPPDLQEQIRSAWKEGLRRSWGVTDDRQVPSSRTAPHFGGRPVVLRTSGQLAVSAQRVLRARPEPASSDENGALAKAYPGRVSGAHADFPEQHKLYWRFRYAGSHSEGVPHYRIVSDDGAWALTTVREGDGQRHIILVTVSAAAAEKDPASLWSVHEADPSGRFGGDYQREWLIQHVSSRRLLGPTETWSSGKVRTVLRDVVDRLRAGSLKPGAPHPYDFRTHAWRIDDPLDTSWQG